MEKILIDIELAGVFSEIDSRMYYQGESMKRKDIDFVSIQTCDDDREILLPIMETALSNINGSLVKRVKDFEWHVGEKSISIELVPYLRIPEDHAGKVALLLKKSIFNYIVNYCCYEWLLVVKPELASVPENRNAVLLAEVSKFIGMISGRIRRRSTDLAGI